MVEHAGLEPPSCYKAQGTSLTRLLWEGSCEKGAGRIEFKVGPGIIASLPREAKGTTEEVLEGIHISEACEMQTNYDQAAIASV